MHSLRVRLKRYLLRLSIRALARVRGPDRRLVLFGAMNGQFYGDNSRHLYEWALQVRPDWKPVWLTRSRAVYRSLRQLGRPAVLIASWQGLICLARARVAVFTNSLRDLSMDPHGVPETLRLVALRHGRSVKRVRFARVGHPLSADEAAERLHESRLTRHAISTSEFISDLQEQSLQIGRHKHVVTGYPRNDDLLRPDAAARAAWQGFLGGVRPKQVALYAPTWRHGREATRFFPFPDFDERALLDFLAQRGLLLLLRPHLNDLLRRPDQRAFLEGLAARGESIRMAAHTAFPDINTILPFVDVLITDYSALYHDFLLLDRPMIFIPYDFEEFNRQNGFLYDYFDELPGPAVGTQQELCLQLEQIHRGADSFEEKRKSLRDRVHSFQDSGARERVGQLIDRMLDEV